VAEAVGALSRNPDVRFAEPNVIITMLEEVFPGPNDPSFVNPPGWPFGYQEHLRHDDATTREIHAEEAWADGCYGQDVVVAVVDTGVDLDHPDLDQNLYRDGAGAVIGSNFVSVSSMNSRGEDQGALAKGGKPGKPPSGDNSPNDDNGHGTHVAGIIAAEMNNVNDSLIETPDANAAWDGGVVGIAPLAKIMPVKVLDSSGSGSADGVAQGILFAADNNARIINLSLGGPVSQTVSDAIHYAHVEHDVLVIAAAGHAASETPPYPASDLYALSIAAVDSADRCASFSNLGWWVDVAARTFAFNTPFKYDGTNNLLIVFSFNNAFYSSEGQCRSTTTATYRSITYASDSKDGDPLSWSGAAPAPVRSQTVPNLLLGATFPDLLPVSLSPTVTTPFVNGVWTGEVTAQEAVTNLVLRADGGSGHVGASNPFAVQAAPRPPLILTGDGQLGITNGHFGFNVQGQAGQVVVFEVSTNLLDWLPLQTNTLGSGLFYFSDPESPFTPVVSTGFS